MIKLLFSTVTTVIACAMLSIASPVLAQTSDEDCAGTMGAGFGLCTAASHLGCGTESEKNGNACTKIEDNFVKITGEMPPWMVPACPCFTAADLREVGDGRSGSCGVEPSGIAGGFISGLDGSWVDAGSPLCSTVDCVIYRELAVVTNQGGNNRCEFSLAPNDANRLVIQTTPDQFNACRDMITDEIANRPISGCGWR